MGLARTAVLSSPTQGLLFAIALASCTSTLTAQPVERSQTHELQILIRQQISRLESGDHKERRDVIRELRFAGIDVICPLLEEDSLEALEAVYALGWFEKMSDEQKRRFCLARIRSTKSPKIPRYLSYIGSGVYSSGTAHVLGEEWAQYVCRTPALRDQIEPLLETSRASLQMIAHWGLRRDLLTAFARGGNQWAALALWQYRDPRIARAFLDGRLPWDLRERMLAWSYGAALYPMNASWTATMSSEQRETLRARNESAWRTLLTDLGEDSVPVWREQRLRDSMGILESIVGWSARELELGLLKGEPDDATQALLSGDVARAVHTVVLQEHTAALPLLRSVLKEVSTILGFMDLPGFQVVAWHVGDLPEVIRESIRRLESDDVRLSAPVRPERVTARWRPFAERLAEVRSAIVQDRPPANHLDWHLFSCHRTGGRRLPHRGLPNSALRLLAQDKDEAVREFAAARLRWGWGWGGGH